MLFCYTQRDDLYLQCYVGDFFISLKCIHFFFVYSQLKMWLLLFLRHKLYGMQHTLNNKISLQNIDKVISFEWKHFDLRQVMIPVKCVKAFSNKYYRMVFRFRNDQNSEKRVTSYKVHLLNMFNIYRFFLNF